MTPEYPPRLPALTAGLHPARHASAHRQLLLVEDDESVAELIRLNLHHRHFDVVVSRSVDAARRRVQASLPQVVLLDWELQDGSGLLLLRQWRSETRTASLPVVMLTGRTQSADVRTAVESGVDDYVTKPCAMRDLINRVNRVVYRKLPPDAGSACAGSAQAGSDQHCDRADGLELRP